MNVRTWETDETVMAMFTRLLDNDPFFQCEKPQFLFIAALTYRLTTDVTGPGHRNGNREGGAGYSQGSCSPENYGRRQAYYQKPTRCVPFLQDHGRLI